MKSVLYAILGLVLIIGSAAILWYLNGVTPPTYVWQGGVKLLVPTGILGMGVGGLFSFVFASEAFQRGSARLDVVD